MSLSSLLVFALILIAVVAVVGYLFKRKQHGETSDPVIVLEGRFKAANSLCTATPPKEFLSNLRHFLTLAELARNFERAQRYQVHINHVSIALAWLETVITDPSADPNFKHTEALSSVLVLMKNGFSNRAMGSLSQLWNDPDLHFKARRLVLMCRISILNSQGMHDEAAADEALLIQLSNNQSAEAVTFDGN